jgi:hypothetical protein
MATDTTHTARTITKSHGDTIAVSGVHLVLVSLSRVVISWFDAGCKRKTFRERFQHKGWYNGHLTNP